MNFYKHRIGYNVIYSHNKFEKFDHYLNGEKF